MRESLICNTEKLQNRILEKNASLSHLDKILKRDTKSLIELYKTHPENPTFVRANLLVITDLTGPTDNGWLFHYSTRAKKTLLIDKYEEEVIQIISREAGVAIAQSYEAFETFLKEILAIFLFHNKALINSKFKKLKEVNSEKESLAKIRECRAGKNNNEIFKLLRKHLSHYNEFEKNDNNLNLDFIIWYEVFSVVRHSVTHSDFSIDKTKISQWTKTHFSYLKTFSNFSENSTHIILTPSVKKTDRTLKIVAEFGFFIFKSVCIYQNLDWKIYDEM